MSARESAEEKDPDVIIWTPVGRDASLSSEVLNRAGIQPRLCTNVSEVCEALSSRNSGLLIVAEEALSSETIQRIGETLKQQPPWSDLPLLLLTSGGTSTEASLNKLVRMRVLGNITLLERPLRSVTLVAAVRSALASRRRQFQTRDYIQELQEAQNELAQANADLKQFAFAASHDLQEPLRMVKIFTQLLLEKHIDPSQEQAREFGEYIRGGVTRMELLLRDLLFYSRVIHQNRERLTVEFDVRAAIEQATTALQVEIEKTGSRIVCGPMPRVRGEETQISLVFQNLLSNSIKYAKEDAAPLIEISAEEGKGEQLIRVQDNGIGFDQKYADRVFDLFQRLGGKDVPGTGLGLAMCRRIIERHGGRIWAESQPGAGATFLFTLPAMKRVE